MTVNPPLAPVRKGPASVRLRRLVRETVGWAVGIPMATFRYLTREVDLHRVDEKLDEPIADLNPDPHIAADESTQPPSEGVGPEFYRRYSLKIRRPRISAEQLIDVLSADPNVAAPVELARFVKLEGSPDEMSVGDEYVVRMPGPWNGPVRVTSRTPHSFGLVTLKGHMEAGEIEFTAKPRSDGAIDFRIESWARSNGWLFHLLYHRLRLSKEVQMHMWAEFCQRAALVAGGKPEDGIEVRTARYEDDGEDDRRSAAPV
jgi:hypothetical protein